MVRIIEDRPREHITRWDTEYTRECIFSYNFNNQNDLRIMSLIEQLISDNQPTCKNCINHYFEPCIGGYNAIQCKIHGNIEYIKHPHYDMDGSKCDDYKRE